MRTSSSRSASARSSNRRLGSAGGPPGTGRYLWTKIQVPDVPQHQPLDIHRELIGPGDLFVAATATVRRLAGLWNLSEFRLKARASKLSSRSDLGHCLAGTLAIVCKMRLAIL
jgi:hypothetical protein